MLLIKTHKSRAELTPITKRDVTVSLKPAGGLCTDGAGKHLMFSMIIFVYQEYWRLSSNKTPLFTPPLISEKKKKTSPTHHQCRLGPWGNECDLGHMNQKPPSQSVTWGNELLGWSN